MILPSNPSRSGTACPRVGELDTAAYEADSGATRSEVVKRLMVKDMLRERMKEL